jgi:photosystem II stability/assembly factor-like uncharacterized protein
MAFSMIHSVEMKSMPSRFQFLPPAAAFATLLTFAFATHNGFAADPDTSEAKWVSVSDETLRQLAADGKKTDWPGETAGVVVDPTTGDVYMIVAGQGVWKSTDRAKTFKRCDGGKVGGRCETAYSLNFDPAGKRLACFMLDGKCAWTEDGGRTWESFKDVGRNWDFAAVDWSAPKVKSILAGLHESGGKVMFSGDGGKSWKQLFEDPEFDRTGGAGIFDEKTLVYAQKGKGIQRSTDAGQTWTKISDREPLGRVVAIVKKKAYWLSKDGLLVSTDKGATWNLQGTAVEASIGPMFDPKDEKRMVVAGVKGIFRTTDGGESWTKIAALPPGADIPKPGWYSNVAWDPIGDIFYVSKMGKPAYRFENEQ